VILAVYGHLLYEEVPAREPASGQRSGELVGSVEVASVEAPGAFEDVEVTQSRVGRRSLRTFSRVFVGVVGHVG
jgi:hypothetical protein